MCRSPQDPSNNNGVRYPSRSDRRVMGHTARNRRALVRLPWILRRPNRRSPTVRPRRHRFRTQGCPSDRRARRRSRLPLRRRSRRKALSGSALRSSRSQAPPRGRPAPSDATHARPRESSPPTRSVLPHIHGTAFRLGIASAARTRSSHPVHRRRDGLQRAVIPSEAKDPTRAALSAAQSRSLLESHGNGLYAFYGEPRHAAWAPASSRTRGHEAAHE
jgi:hypothetical protein